MLCALPAIAVELVPTGLPGGLRAWVDGSCPRFVPGVLVALLLDPTVTHSSVSPWLFVACLLLGSWALKDLAFAIAACFTL